MMECKESRLKSFGDSPRSSSLAEDGFFLDSDGVIKCFSCGLPPETEEIQQSYHGGRPCDFVLYRHRHVPHKRFTDLEDLKFETHRLSTFSIDWPHDTTGVKPEDLAKDGFYYTRTLDWCECIFCGIILGEWDGEETPRERHQRYFCPFIEQQEKVGNVPKESSDRYFLKINNEPNYIHYPQYKDASERQHSFSSWPPLTQNRDDLWNAGFFYFGKSDHVMCFCCGNGLRNWLVGENPWVEHARYYPHCPFVRVHLSPDFFNRIERDYV